MSFEDLESAGLLGTGPRCWHRDLPALAKRRERLAGLAFHSPDRIEAWALWDEAAAAALGSSVGVELASTRAEASSAPTSESEAAESAAESEVAPMPLLALGAAPGALGRLGLAAVIDELGRLAGEAPLLLSRAAPDELDAELLAELGFEPGGEHLLFTSLAQAA